MRFWHGGDGVRERELGRVIELKSPTDMVDD